jgi:hypothetical protein
MRIIIRILKDYFPHLCWLFINNINVKRSRTIYNNEKTLLEIRKFIFKYI